MTRLPAADFLFRGRGGLVLDVRSPGEYTQAHLPGAHSLPLFTDEERKQVGTAYKQQSREQAIKIGLDFFGPKMRGMVEEVEHLCEGRLPVKGSASGDPLEAAHRSSEIFLYCWRGGMRSGAVAWLLQLYGFRVTVLDGGYKAFRNWVLQTVAQPFPLRLLGGYTGSGKTSILAELKKRGQPVVDLEALAGHKGSAFGNLGMPPQPTQEMFENRLALALYEAANGEGPDAPSPLTVQPRGHNPIWLEDESQRIGHVNIPKPFWENMRHSPLSFLDLSFEQRLQRALAEYGSFPTERLQAAVERIAKRLGPADTKAAVQHLVEEQTEAAFRILLRYYDRQYDKALRERQTLGSEINRCTGDGDPAVDAGHLMQSVTFLSAHV